jgi:hypothetical protein
MKPRNEKAILAVLGELKGLIGSPDLFINRLAKLDDLVKIRKVKKKKIHNES